jgi:hypothetical protein
VTWLLLLLLFETAVDRKLNLIEADKLPAGSRVVFTARELNDYAREEAPKGVRGIKLELGVGLATASAVVDLNELNKVQGGPSNFILEKLLAGERPLRVTARIQSANGQLRVDIESVEFAGMTLEHAMVDFLIQHFIMPKFPNARVGEWVPLVHRVDRIEIKPAAATVVLSGKSPL